VSDARETDPLPEVGRHLASGTERLMANVWPIPQTSVAASLAYFLAAVGRVFGAYAISEGVLVVLTGIWRTRYRGVLLAEGASGIVAGLVALAWPGITALVLLYLVAIWAIFSGVAEMIAAVSLRREIEGEWALFLVGSSPSPGGGDGGPARRGLLSLAWLVGLYALAVGVALIVLAFRVRGLRRREGPKVALTREEATNDHATRRHKRARGRRPARHGPARRTASHSRTGGTEHHAAQKELAVVRAHTARELSRSQVPLSRP
jgi:uncharacterized membrane protein HdeD (DUF308 family)